MKPCAVCKFSTTLNKEGSSTIRQKFLLICCFSRLPLTFKIAALRSLCLLSRKTWVAQARRDLHIGRWNGTFGTLSPAGLALPEPSPLSLAGIVLLTPPSHSPLLLHYLCPPTCGEDSHGQKEEPSSSQAYPEPDGSSSRHPIWSTWSQAS